MILASNLALHFPLGARSLFVAIPSAVIGFNQFILSVTVSPFLSLSGVLQKWVRSLMISPLNVCSGFPLVLSYPCCSSWIWLKPSSLVTLRWLPCAYCTESRFFRLTFKVTSVCLLLTHPCLLSSSIFVTHSPWSHWEVSPSPVTMFSFLTRCLFLPFLLPSAPPSYSSCFIVYALLTAVFNQCYLLGILLKMPWQMETHPCPAGPDSHTVAECLGNLC